MRQVRFTVSVGGMYEREEVQTFATLGWEEDYEPTEEELDAEWKAWMSNYLDGGVTVEETK